MERPRLVSNSARLTGIPRLDGAIGVLIGLYMASHPAGNMLDLLLFIAGDVREKLLTTPAGRAWLALNVLVLLAAWFVIFSGIMRFVQN